MENSGTAGSEEWQNCPGLDHKIRVLVCKNLWVSILVGVSKQIPVSEEVGTESFVITGSLCQWTFLGLHPP